MQSAQIVCVCAVRCWLLARRTRLLNSMLTAFYTAWIAVLAFKTDAPYAWLHFKAPCLERSETARTADAPESFLRFIVCLNNYTVLHCSCLCTSTSPVNDKARTAEPADTIHQSPEKFSTFNIAVLLAKWKWKRPLFAKVAALPRFSIKHSRVPVHCDLNWPKVRLRRQHRSVNFISPPLHNGLTLSSNESYHCA